MSGTEALRTGFKHGTGELSSGGNATLYECKQTTERTHAPVRLVGFIAAKGAFSLVVRLWNGTTYTSAYLVDSSTITTAKGGTTDRTATVFFDIHCPPYTEVVITDTSSATNPYEFNIFGVNQ